MSLARGARLVGWAWQRQAAAGGAPPMASGGAQAQRAFADHSHGDPGQYVTYAGLTLKKAPYWEYAASKVVGGFMWFWVFKMLYDNWDHKIYGLAGVFEREGLDDDDDGDDGHGHGHGHH